MNRSETCQKLLKDLQDNPKDYDKYVEVISLFKESGDLSRLRTARNDFAAHFPLTPELWKDWIDDERRVCISKEETDSVKELFERSVKDYYSLETWLSYLNFMESLFDEEKVSAEDLRSLFESAVSAAGVQVRGGGRVWERYRLFEIDELEDLGETGADAESVAAAKQRVSKLFRRQLSLPLEGNSQVLTQAEELLADDQEALESLKKIHAKSQKQVNLRLPHEDAVASNTTSLETWEAYIQLERTKGDPSRVVHIYERAITNCCLEICLWESYSDFVLKILRSVSEYLNVCKRAIRNVPWSAEMWQRLMRAQERAGEGAAAVQQTLQDALRNAFSCAEDYLNLHLSVVDCLRRLHMAGVADVAEEHIWSAFDCTEAFLEQMYPKWTAALVETLQYRAHLGSRLAAKDSNVGESWSQEAPKIAQEKLVRRLGNLKSSWMFCISGYRLSGDMKSCRNLYRRGVQRVSDFPEEMWNSWLRFEREEGSLDDFEAVQQKAKPKLEEIAKRKAREESKPTAKEKRPKAKDKKRKFESEKQKEAAPRETMVIEEDPNALPLTFGSSKGSESTAQKKKRKLDRQIEGNDVEMEDAQQSNNKSSETQLKEKINDLPKESTKESSKGEPIRKPPKETEEERAERGSRTVFIKNLSFKASDEDIAKLFLPCGEVQKAWVVRSTSGKSRGMAYVQFESQESIKAAVTLKGTELHGRKIQVEKYRHLEKSPFEKALRKGSSTLKNASHHPRTIYIKNLPPEVTSKMLEEFMQQNGDVVCARVVVDPRTGQSKGHGLVEFKEEAGFEKALELNGKEFKDSCNILSVTRSFYAANIVENQATNPYLQDNDMKQPPKRASKTNLMMVPTALKRRSKTPIVRKPTGQSGNSNSSQAQENKKLETSEMTKTSLATTKTSNADFRAMFLKQNKR